MLTENSKKCKAKKNEPIEVTTRSRFRNRAEKDSEKLRFGMAPKRGG
jgi:hypothetical protein